MLQTLLARISAAVGRWDRATELPIYRYVGILLGLSVFGALMLLPTPEGLSVEAHRAASVTAVMAIWWVGRVLPMAVTAMVPLIAFPVLGVLGFGDTAMSYAHPLNLLMLGGFLIGHAVEETGLHRRVVAGVLGPRWIRVAPERSLLALMFTAAGLSMVVSNTATTLMMLPVAMALGAHAFDDKRLQGLFVLGLAYASSLGGVGTLVGTPPNAVLAAQLPERITFASWAAVGIPFALIGVPVAWWVLTRVAVPMPKAKGEIVDAPRASPWTRSQGIVVALVCLAMLAWLTRKPIETGIIDIPGWYALFPEKWGDSFVAIGVALLLFIVPSDDDRPFVMSVERMEKRIPWSVLILLGGGFAMAAGIAKSGLTGWLAKSTWALESIQASFGPGSVLGVFVVTLVLSLGMTFLTELTSNTATSQIVLPVLAAGASAAGVDPVLWMVPATIAASCAFMMPVATAPNAIACQAGGVAPGDMAWAGLVLNVLLAVFVAVLCAFWLPFVMPT